MVNHTPPMFTTIYWKSPSPGEVTSSLSVAINGSLFKSWHTWLSPSQPLAASGFHHIWPHLQLPGRLPTIFGGLVKFVPWCDSHTQSVKFVKKNRTPEFQPTNPKKTEGLHGGNRAYITSPTFLSHHHPENSSPNLGVGSWGGFFPKNRGPVFSRWVSSGVGCLMWFPQTENKGLW